MTINIAAISYGIGAAAYLALTLLLVTAWRGRLQGGLLLAASAISTLWCAAVVLFAIHRVPPFSALMLLEVLRDALWCLFLARLLGLTREEARSSGRAVHLLIVSIFALCVGLAAIILINRYSGELQAVQSLSAGITVLGHTLLAVLALTLLHQVYRNTPYDQRWAIKFLYYGIGGLFVFDFYMYANALLFKQIDGVVWTTRGIINAMAVPLIMVSASRNPKWSLDVFVSRHVVFHTAALLGAGIYLLVMAAAGYYIRVYGGTWGGVAQIAFLSGAVILLIVLMQSTQLRARARVFLGKHFYKNRYDYREEWLRFTQRLSSTTDGRELKVTIVRAIADIVESPGGVLWQREEGGRYVPVAADHASVDKVPTLAADDPLIGFMQARGWVVFADELARDSEAYEGLGFPAWLDSIADRWVVTPLMQGEDMVAFAVLRRSPTRRDLNWEDRDLLKTVGRQAASYLVLYQATDALAEARQFEAFNRLSAYVVHDLKNLVAQLDLVVANAKRHMHSPGFIEDAVETVGNASAKMSRLLGQLKKGRMETHASRAVSLAEVLETVVASRQAATPAPVLEPCADNLRVTAEPDRLAAVIEHLIQNAQEATPADGRVTVRARADDGWALVEVQDTGAGMDARFIAERLFKPFDTTKGNAGMGVGVYESREFVHALGGEIHVESEPRRGTLFRVRLPLVAARSPTETDPEPREAAG